MITIGAVVAAFRTISQLKEQVRHNETAANAAKSAAEIAERSLRVLNQPWLDTENWRVTHEHRADDIPDGSGGRIRGRLEFLTIGFDVVNNSRTPATIYEIEVRDTGSGSPPVDYSVTAAVGNVITPGMTYPYEANLTNLAPSQLARYEKGSGVVLTIEGTIHFGDPFVRRGPSDSSGPRLRHFGRQCLLSSRGSTFYYIAGAERVES